MSDILKDKTVVVTGASSGIGRAIAIEALGVPTRFFKADVSSRADNEALVAAADEFGGVDVMVLNAGISLRSDGADVREEDYRRLMSINLDGTLFGAQAAATHMKARDTAGSIVLMASMGGIVGAGITVAYSTSKGGVVLMAKALADALGPNGIRVNAIAPGPIDTELLRKTPDIAAASEGFRQRTPLRRLGQPSEIGDAVAFLGSDLSSYITGIALQVDVGLLAVI